MLERPHRTPFKLRLRAQAGEGMRSEGQRRRVEIPTGFTSNASTVYRAARLPPSTAVYDPQPLDSVYHVYFVDDVYRLPPSTTVYLVDGRQDSPLARISSRPAAALSRP